MPPGSDAVLALADQLRSRENEALAELLTGRGVATAGIRDFFDLADALLQPESVRDALSRLPRPSLIALRAIAELGTTSMADASADVSSRGGVLAADAVESPRAAALLLESDGMLTVPAPVARALAAGFPPLSELIAERPPTTLAPVGSADPALAERVASERAFATTASVAELIAELHRDAARELARGGVALPDSRRLATSAGVGLERVPELLAIAERAGLVASAGERVATPAGRAWLPLSSVQRWSALAGAWLDRLPLDVRQILRDRAGARWSGRIEDYLRWLYPAGGQWIAERMSTYLRDAESLGITHDCVPSRAGGLLLTDGAEAAAGAIGFPAEVDRVYLQRDLTVVSPGPLAPKLATRLRGIAEAEGGGLASAYRITTASLNRALASGETAESIHEFLADISLTGMPQPLRYLIREAAERHGLVRVRRSPSGGSSIRSVDVALLRTLAVDAALAPLGLSRSPEELTSRFEPGVVFWSLAEARYPVAAENDNGETITLERPRRAGVSAAVRSDPIRSLIERLRLGSPTDDAATDRAWLARQLDVAIRGKLGLTVTVTLQDGSSAVYQLEPASVAGGRLRARDRRTDLERTLPLSSITAVGPAE